MTKQEKSKSLIATGKYENKVSYLSIEEKLVANGFGLVEYGDANPMILPVGKNDRIAFVEKNPKAVDFAYAEFEDRYCNYTIYYAWESTGRKDSFKAGNVLYVSREVFDEPKPLVFIE